MCFIKRWFGEKRRNDPSVVTVNVRRKTPQQLTALQKPFRKNTYPTVAEVKGLCESTNLDYAAARVTESYICLVTIMQFVACVNLLV